MVPPRTIVMKATNNIHVYVERVTMGVGRFKYHGTTTMDQQERA